MKSTSKVIMGSTLVMVLSLAIVLSLMLVLLAEIYCTLLLRRRQLRTTSSNNNITTTVTTPTGIISPTLDASSSSQHPQPQNQQSSSPLTNYYAQGVLQAPRSLLFPAAFCSKDTTTEPVNKHSQQHHVPEVPAQGPNTIPQLIGVTSPSKSPRALPVQIIASNACNEKACAVGGEHLVYISNPIYDNEASRPGLSDTPFETPDSSPSRLDTGGCSSSGDEEMSPSSPLVTPPLTPMKKLPAEACSISLRDASSLGISGSDSVSQNGLSSSSSGTAGTSPSW